MIMTLRPQREVETKLLFHLRFFSVTLKGRGGVPYRNFCFSLIEHCTSSAMCIFLGVRQRYAATRGELASTGFSVIEEAVPTTFSDRRGSAVMTYLPAQTI